MKATDDKNMVFDFDDPQTTQPDWDCFGHNGMEKTQEETPGQESTLFRVYTSKAASLRIDLAPNLKFDLIGKLYPLSTTHRPINPAT